MGDIVKHSADPRDIQERLLDERPLANWDIRFKISLFSLWNIVYAQAWAKFGIECGRGAWCSKSRVLNEHYELMISSLPFLFAG
jgi:hypothetical protein